ncbi:MAG: hypothetical protein GEV07_05180 [Streptosporangiales bacterium]|nr:hypothetical protein [Streptosporangiales bacterium]
MGRDELLSAVRALGLPEGKYAVFGRGPLVVRGLRTSNHITIAVTVDVFRRLIAADGWDVHRADDGREVLRCGSFEVVDRIELPGYQRTGKALVTASERVDGVPVVRLAELQKLLEARKHRDDETDLNLVRRALRDASPRPQEPGLQRSPEEGTWDGTGLAFLVRALTKPAATFATGHGVRFWPTAYLVSVASVAVNGLGAAIHGNGDAPGSPLLPLVGAPLIAALGLLVSLLISRVALGVARGGGGDGDYVAAASQAAIVTAVWDLPASLVQLAVGPGAAAALKFVSLVAYVYLAYLYAGAYRVSVARGLFGAVVGTLALLAGVISVAVVVALLVMAGT